MRLLEDKGRKYKRYRPSANEKIQLAEENRYTDKGLQWVLSSNVSAVGVNGEDLIIRFHNGSVYRYFKKSNKINSILTSNSKGHWVWVNLRWKNVRYQKIGSVPLESDTPIDDTEIFEKLDTNEIRVESPHVLDQQDIMKTTRSINIIKDFAKILILDDITGIKAIPGNIITNIRQM